MSKEEKVCPTFTELTETHILLADTQLTRGSSKAAAAAVADAVDVNLSNLKMFDV